MELGFGQTDNLNKDTVGLRSDMTILGLGFSARRDRALARGALAGDVDLLKYGAADVADDDEVLGSIDGILELHAVPDRFRWDFGGNFGQVRTDPRAPVGPDNRERTRVVSTGPALAWPFGRRSVLEVGAEVADRRFERTETLDSRLTSTRVGISRSVSPVTRVAITFEQSENEFDADLDTYEFEIVSLEYRKRLASGSALVRAGSGTVDIGGESEDTVVATLAWDRAVGARSRLFIWGGRELTDAGGLFVGGGAIGGDVALSSLADVVRTTDGRLRDVTLSSSPLRRQSAGARFEVRGEAATFRLSVAQSEDRFEFDETLDNDLTTVQVSGSRQFGPRWRGEVSATQWDQDFTVLGTANEDQSLGLVVARAVGRSSRLEVEIQRNRRVGDLDPFDENVVIVSIGKDFRR